MLNIDIYDMSIINDGNEYIMWTVNTPNENTCPMISKYISENGVYWKITTDTIDLRNLLQLKNNSIITLHVIKDKDQYLLIVSSRHEDGSTINLLKSNDSKQWVNLGHIQINEDNTSMYLEEKMIDASTINYIKVGDVFKIYYLDYYITTYDLVCLESKNGLKLNNEKIFTNYIINDNDFCPIEMSILYNNSIYELWLITKTNEIYYMKSRNNEIWSKPIKVNITTTPLQDSDISSSIILKDNDVYKLWFIATTEDKSTILYAHSRDGVDWEYHGAIDFIFNF